MKMRVNKSDSQQSFELYSIVYCFSQALHLKIMPKRALLDKIQN
jgi:hypothetical protein